MKTLIRNATVVTPVETLKANVLIEDSMIASVDAARHASADTDIDASGLYLIPGVVDDQVHFREPGLTHKEDFSHATRACAKGGVTSFLEMPNTIPAVTNQQVLDDKLRLAAKHCHVNYGFYIGATPDNIADLKSAERTPGIKIFIGSSTGNLLVDDQEVLERIFAETDLPICAHCEDEQTVQSNWQRYASSSDVATHSLVRDREAAVKATRRAIDLAVRHRHRFHVLHVSSRDELPLIREARGQVTAEVCPHHLFFNTEDYPRLGSLVKMNPSVKTGEDNQALWLALLDGTIQVIATDHAPHTLQEKAQPYPNCPSGVPAVENSLALLLHRVYLGECTLQQVVEWMCAAPARTWDLLGKGQIIEGNDADLVLVDLDKRQTVLNEHQETKCRWSPWHGTELVGWPVKTWVLGQQVFGLDASGRPSFAKKPHGGEIRFDHALGGYWGSV